MTVGLVLRAFLLAIAAMVVNVLVAFLWVWIYSIAIAPGHDEAFYQSYAERAAPISSVIAGIPILFLAGWWMARRSPGPGAIGAASLVAILYTLVDASVLAAIAGAAAPWGIAALSAATKLLAAAAGGYVAAGVRSRA